MLTLSFLVGLGLQIENVHHMVTLSALIFVGLNFGEFRGCQIFEHFAGLEFREFRGQRNSSSVSPI